MDETGLMLAGPIARVYVRTYSLLTIFGESVSILLPDIWERKQKRAATHTHTERERERERERENPSFI